MEKPELAPATSARSASGFLVSSAVLPVFLRPTSCILQTQLGSKGQEDTLLVVTGKEEQDLVTLLKSWGQGDIASAHKRSEPEALTQAANLQRAQQSLLNWPMLLLSRQSGAQHTEFGVVVSLQRFETGSHSVAKAKPKLTTVLLPQPSESWDSRNASPCSVSTGL